MLMLCTQVEKLVKALKEYYKDDSHYAPSTETTKLKSVEVCFQGR